MHASMLPRPLHVQQLQKQVWGTSGAMEALSHIIAHQWRARYGKGNKDYIELVCVLVEGVLPSR